MTGGNIRTSMCSCKMGRICTSIAPAAIAAASGPLVPTPLAPLPSPHPPAWPYPPFYAFSSRAPPSFSPLPHPCPL